MIEWVKDRLEGYILTKGVRKATEVALVTVAGGLASAFAKPVVVSALEKLKEFGVSASWDGSIFSLQVNVGILVTAGVAGAGALLFNFVFRKKDAATKGS